MEKDFKIKGHYWVDPDLGSTFGTFWRYGETWFTAAHVITEMNYCVPEFISSELENVYRPFVNDDPNGLDISIYRDKNNFTYPEVKKGMEVVIAGFPAGSRHLSVRTGKVYTERSTGRWITILQQDNYPVVVGMSGGVVLTKIDNDYIPVGVLISRNSLFDSDGDGIMEESCDFISINQSILAHTNQ